MMGGGISQLPWELLTRCGTEIPAFRAIRRPITTQGRTIDIGMELPDDLFPPSIHRARLQQFYQVGLIEPVEKPAGLRAKTGHTSKLKPAIRHKPKFVTPATSAKGGA